MKEAIITVGISASGKSTWAEEFCTQNPGFYIINRDEIRALLLKDKTGENFNWRKWRWKWEDEVSEMQWKFIQECADAVEVKGIIISDTNLDTNRNDQLIEKLNTMGFNASFKFFDIDLDEAIARDKRRGPLKVGDAVLRKQYSKYLQL